MGKASRSKRLRYEQPGNAPSSVHLANADARVTTKDVLLLVIATLPTFSGLRTEDNLVMAVCLSVSWAAIIALCVIHQGSKIKKSIIAFLVTMLMGAFGIRLYSQNVKIASLSPADVMKATEEGARKGAKEAFDDLEARIKSSLGSNRLSAPVPGTNSNIRNLPLAFLQFERADSVESNLPIAPGKPMLVNVYFRNRGTYPVTGGLVWSVLTYATMAKDSDKQINSKFTTLVHRLHKTHPTGGVSIGVGNDLWNTASSEPMTVDKIEALVQGKSRLVLTALAMWKDEKLTSQEWPVCQWFTNVPAPGETVKAIAWHNCEI